MNVLYSVLCESADSRPDGRVDVGGIFHHLFAPGFPAQQDRMVLLVVLEWAPEEAGRRSFRIDLLDPAQSPVATITGHSDVSQHVAGQPLPQTRLVMPMDNVVFPMPGRYQFSVEVAGERTGLCPVYLMVNPEE